MAVKSLTWKDLARYYDGSGNLSQEIGWRSRLRICSYDRGRLESFRKIIGSGSISGEQKTRGRYYRLEIGGAGRVRMVLTKILPFLEKKRHVVEGMDLGQLACAAVTIPLPPVL
jgi:hypothetical protein